MLVHHLIDGLLLNYKLLSLTFHLKTLLFSHSSFSLCDSQKIKAMLKNIFISLKNTMVFTLCFEDKTSSEANPHNFNKSCSFFAVSFRSEWACMYLQLQMIRGSAEDASPFFWLKVWSQCWVWKVELPQGAMTQDVVWLPMHMKPQWL